jgi:sugar phosphate isomerase/epimerase
MALSPSQFGICSWSTHPHDPADLAARIKELGLNKVQLAVQGIYLQPELWGNVKNELAAQGVTIVSGMFGTKGEDYSTLETIRKTGGFIPDEHWDSNWLTVRQVAKVSAALGLNMVSSHAGFLPADDGAGFQKLVDRISQVAKYLGAHGQSFIFETGQETADTLHRFLTTLNKAGVTNTGVNFDPANMILYNMGDPVSSLKKLMPFVQQIHVKDATRSTTPGTWGVEVPIGEGDVDWAPFLKVLSDANFKGNLIIEREAGQDRVGDVRKAIERITKLM